jgi:hypothetical protein
MIKTVVKAHYVHKSNVMELINKKIPKEEQALFYRFLNEVDKLNIEYTIIKYDSGNITLIYSPDWDTANEPIVEVCYRWKSGEWFDENGNFNTNPKIQKNGRQIYHNKWQFVGEDYKGFDIEEAKKRTILWNSIPNLNKSKIGNKTYWIELLKENNIAI